MSANNSSKSKSLPQAILEFIVAFMRTLNSARLYASGHALLKKQTEQLYGKLQAAMGDETFLFMGYTGDALFMEGDFYKSKDASALKFIQFFHDLGISHMILDKEMDRQEIESFVSILAGARQGQGEEVVSTLSSEGIRYAKLGLMDYSVFSTIQSVASQMAHTGEDEAVWRQLILQPAAAGALHLSPEKAKQLRSLAENAEELKKLLLDMDSNIKDQKGEITVLQRGAVLGNFLENLGDTLEGVSEADKRGFAGRVFDVLNALDPSLKIHILGSTAPAAGGGKGGGVIDELFESMSDNHLVSLLVDAVKETGVRSTCFNNIFERAVEKHKDLGVLAALIRKEMEQRVKAGETGPFLQNLDQFLVQNQEVGELNRKYHDEIQALATSIQMQTPMVEDDEKKRLLDTLRPESLLKDRARLIVDLICHPQSAGQPALYASLPEGLEDVLNRLVDSREYSTVGRILRSLFLGLSDHPQEEILRKQLNSQFNSNRIREILSNLLEKCRTFKPEETAALNAVCYLFPEKAGMCLLDLQAESGEWESPRSRWIASALKGLGPVMTRVLNQRLPNATDGSLPGLLTLVSEIGDSGMAGAVEHYLDHQDHDIRLKVIMTLGSLKAERSVPGLSGILLQKSFVKTKKTKAIQAEAARALAGSATAEARKTLKAVASKGSGELKKLCRELL
jgi:hypothetical protein